MYEGCKLRIAKAIKIKRFDKISHEWLIKHALMDKEILKKWLKAGYVENGLLHHTDEGTPQGGIISPNLANIALDGLEAAIKKVVRREEKVHFVRYADDFIVTGASREILESRVKPVIIDFMKERGLELSPEKTKITHIDEGFDFLGFNVRKYGGKLLIKPAKKGIKSFLDDIRGTVKSMRAVKTENLIKYLNVKIQGWVNYYRHCVAKATFSYIDNSIFWIVWEVGQKATSEQRSILDPKEVLHYLRTQKMVLLLEDENGRTRIPYSSHTGTTHEDRKTRESQRRSFAIRSQF